MPITTAGKDYVVKLFHRGFRVKGWNTVCFATFYAVSIEEKEPNQNIFILTATSDDTGLYGFKNIGNIKIRVFYPKIGTSEIQKKANDTKNVFVRGIDGNFDNAQSGMKPILEYRYRIYATKKPNTLSANSINILRLILQL